MKYPVLLVEWLDAEDRAGWVDISEEMASSIKPVISIGWLLHENAHRIILVGCMREEDNEVSSRQHIPVGMIVRRTTLWDPLADIKWNEMWNRPFRLDLT